jgi:glycosyltransferase involved in cell wall biosynthesis
MNDILISIITVTFNAASTIEKTIGSVSDNKSSRTEYIIIDGGSNDETVDLLNQHRDSIDKWISEPDQGIYDAMNKGIAMATGKWILFLGADDLLSVDISQIESTLEKGIHYYGNVRLRSSRRLYDGKFNRYKILQRNICHQAVIYYADVFRDRMFDIRYKIAADYEMNLYLFGTQFTKIKYIDNVISDFDDSGISSKTTDMKFRSDLKFLFFMYFPIYIYPIYPIARLHYYLSRVLQHIKRLIG